MAKKESCNTCKGTGIVTDDELFPIPYNCPDCKKNITVSGESEGEKDEVQK